MMFGTTRAALAAVALAGTLLPAPLLSAAPTRCDRMAAHPSDPDRRATGLARTDIDLPAAEAACREAVSTDPRSARAHYQLGRVLFYQDKVEESLKHLEIAAGIGYPQAIFVLGYVLLDGKTSRDECRAARLWLQSAGLDHPWSGYYLVQSALDRRFEKCGLDLTRADLERHLALAGDNVSVTESAGRIEALIERLEASDTAKSSQQSGSRH